MALTQKQQAARRGGIGASEIAALAGLSKWSSPIAIYEAKVLGREVESTYRMALGNEMEAPIARVWASERGKFIALVDTLQHLTLPLALATPDRAVYATQAQAGDRRKKRTDVRDAEALLQVKSSSWRMQKFWGPDDSDEIPTEYLAQAHWEGSVAGLGEVIFAVDFDKTALHQYRVRVSPEVFAGLYEVAARFWRDHVEARVPPPPDASDAYGEFLERVFPRERDEALVRVEPGSDPELEEAVARFIMLKVADKRLKGMKEKCYQLIASRIGERAGLAGSFGAVTWKRTRDSVAVQWRPLAEEAVEMLRGIGISGERLDALVKAHTVTKPGHRTMRTKPAAHLVFEDALTLNLPSSTEPTDEEAPL